MTDWIKATKDFVWKYKKGALVGGLLGWFVIAPLITKDASSLKSLQSMGLIDVAQQTMGIVDVAKSGIASFVAIKAKLFAVALGVTFGMFAEAQLEEGFLKNFLRGNR